MSSLFPEPGPHLPPFQTLLVKGKYHPSAPLHLSMSFLAHSPTSQAIIITPSRKKLAQALREYEDDWFKQNSGRGSFSELSLRVKLFYPPTPAHFGLLVSMLRVTNPSDDKSGPWLHPKTTLAVPPSVLVLHELSSYFDGGLGSEPNLSNWTVSSYLSLVMHALSSASTLCQGSRCGAVALFDAGLDSLRLPMMKPLAYAHLEHPPTPRLESVSIYVERYFEWIGIANEEEYREGFNAEQSKGIRLYHCKRPNEAVEWHWKELAPSGDAPQSPRGTRIFWGP